MITNTIISIQNLLAIDSYDNYLFTFNILNINFRYTLNSPSSVELLKSVEVNATRRNLK